MEGAERRRAVAAATSIASTLGLAVDDATVLQDSNTLTVRLRPCDVVARVAHRGQEVARFEVELARRLARSGSPVAALEPRVAPRPYEDDGFVVTLWTYHEPVTAESAPAGYAAALERLHAGMRAVDLPTPHVTDRVASAERIVTRRDLSPSLADADREMLTSTLRRLRRVIVDGGAPEQLLHGEPHPGNVLATADGPVFIDLETCCHGPVELDLAHVPRDVSDLYPGVDHALLGDCRQLVLAMVAAWRWERGDQLPNGPAFGRALLRVLRTGPPWPTLDEVVAHLDPP